jgi:hypothetical protein
MTYFPDRYFGHMHSETTIEIFDPTVDDMFEYLTPRNEDMFEVDGNYYFVL